MLIVVQSTIDTSGALQQRPELDMVSARNKVFSFLMPLQQETIFRLFRSHFMLS